VSWVRCPRVKKKRRVLLRARPYVWCGRARSRPYSSTAREEAALRTPCARDITGIVLTRGQRTPRHPPSVSNRWRRARRHIRKVCNSQIYNAVLGTRIPCLSLPHCPARCKGYMRCRRPTRAPWVAGPELLRARRPRSVTGPNKIQRRIGRGMLTGCLQAVS
jgi:hypothetical protein